MRKIIGRKILNNLALLIVFGVVGLLLHEAYKGVPMFQLSDITALRPTHEKFIVLLLLGGLYIQARKNHAAAK